MNDAAGSTHIVCPQCSAINRIPRARLGDHPSCGSCKQPLFAARPLELTGASFDRHISRSGIPVVVDFWAEWCGPCRMMAPAFEQAARELEPQVRLCKLDTEAAPTIAQRFGIRSIPTMIVFNDGREVARQAGAMGAADIERWLSGAIAGATA